MEKNRALSLLEKIPYDFPLVKKPYRQIAGETGISEEELIATLIDMEKSGIVRRVSAIISHRKVSYSYNAMVVWKANPEDIEKSGHIMASFDNVSHCYERDTDNYWVYNLYTMIHGKSREECMETVEQIVCKTGLSEYRIFFSTREFKKTSFSVSHE